MSQLTGRTGQQKMDPRPYMGIAVGVVLILYLIIAIGQSTATPAPRTSGRRMNISARIPPDPNVDPAAAAAYVKTLARRYGDRFDRLTSDDRVFLNSIAMGHGRELLRMEASKVQGASNEGGKRKDASATQSGK
jgi:hypothetical protein